MINCICRKSLSGSTLCYSWFSAMHTRVDIVLVSNNHTEEQMRKVADDIAESIRLIERDANCFSPYSAISRLNAAPVGRSVSLPQWLCGVLRRCITYHALTDGLFDITALSPQFTPQSIRSLIIGDGSAAISQPGTSINLSGIIKGYAADQAIKKVRTAGIENALINLGNSSIAAIGNMDSNALGWKISTLSTQLSTSENNVFTLQNKCLSTSGNDSPSRQHIINPLTGMMQKGMGQVSVVSTTATDGEVLSTALFIANENQRQHILSRIKAKQVVFQDRAKF